MQPEASTSQLPPQESESTSGDSHEAPEYALPQTTFYSVEYPGYVQPTSVSKAIQNLGGQSKLDHVFKRMASKTETLMELSLHPENPFAHPVPGDIVNTNNLLLKVTRKWRKRTSENTMDGAIGEYMAEIVGVISKSVRFRSMVDFQYLPNMDDPVAQLRLAMDNMDADSICSYTIPDNKAERTILPSSGESTEGDIGMDFDPPSVSNLRLFPPPLLSRQGIPQGYNYKANSASMITTTIDEETGEERKRLINKMRWKGYGPASITFADSQIPGTPPDSVEHARDQVKPNLLQRLHELFAERPIWTRMSLFNQFSTLEAREMLNFKMILPLVCYVFQDGPWRDTLVRFSYDPRTDSNARLYQRLYFRNANHPILRPSVVTRRQDRANVNTHMRTYDQEGDRKTSHIFDGKTITKETAAFQLCDIVDPMLKRMIEDPDALRETCDERDGWYTSHAFERIKTVLRHKFFSVLEGHPATDEDCKNLIANEGSSKAASSHRNQKLRTGKHNMAKGALRPEDAAAMRLRATLDRNVKSLASQK